MTLQKEKKKKKSLLKTLEIKQFLIFSIRKIQKKNKNLKKNNLGY